MSVDYEAFIGIGWVISDQEREDMIEANYALYKEGKAPCVEDEFYHINAYTGGDVFLGDRIACVDEGEYSSRALRNATSRKRLPTRSSTSWKSSRNTASTRPIPPPMPISPTRQHT